MSVEPLFVSVVVPCRNEVGYIAACLDSILSSEYPADRLEILVIDGRSNDGTRAIVESYAARSPGVRLIDNPKGITPVALNQGIRVARGEIVIRMDVHVVYPPEYIPRLVAALQTSGADNVGAVLVTRPASDKPMARAIAVALSHPFGVGNSYFRIGVTAPRWVDTVAFFCCRRSLFDRVGMFDEELVRHQDGEFNARLIGRGGRILLIPDVRSYYYARETLSQVRRMYFQYGYFKPLVARKLGRIMTLRQMVPPLFVVSLIGSALAGIWLPAAAILSAGIAGLYGALIAACSFGAARRHGAKVALALAVVFPVLHVSYGLGFLRRLVELVTMPETRRVAELPLSR